MLILVTKCKRSKSLRGKLAARPGAIQAKKPNEAKTPFWTVTAGWRSAPDWRPRPPSKSGPTRGTDAGGEGRDETVPGVNGCLGVNAPAQPRRGGGRDGADAHE